MLLIDSGADVTLLPRTAVDQLGVVIMDDQYEIMGFDARITLAAVARVDLLFLRRTFKGSYLLIDQDHGILGRDILNLLALVLDGPGQTWYDQRPIANKT
ncbi:MAG: hypothetical protein H0X37_22050 [Herpetosiphonaceae bacterium]|nr:hypothetical protein [Herpetosiphonaceae bacterium]